MDDERWVPGMPALDRQAIPGPSRGPAAPQRPAEPPRSVPETRPTPLRAQYVNLSAIALVCGAIAISALEAGVPLGSLLVKLCVLIGTPPLVVAMGDALVRIWRSAVAWLPVDRGRGLFRLAWVAAIVVLYVLLAVAVWAVATA